MIQCTINVTLPDHHRDTNGKVNIYCGMQENDKGEIIPGNVGIRPHGLRHDQRGMHNVCESRICVHNTQLRPPDGRKSIFDLWK